MTVKLYKSDELSNEEYRKINALCGTDIVTIMNSSLKKWRYGKRAESTALGFGIAAHMVLLEPEKFDDEFVVEPDVSGAMKTIAELKAYAKELGLKIKAAATKVVIIQQILESDPDAQIAEHILAEFREENKDKNILPAADYQKILNMRKAVFEKPKLAELLTGSTFEFSIVAELDGIPVRIRPDVITKSGGIIDYKTTRDCNPEQFVRLAYNGGYFAKMAFQHDVFEVAYGQPPKFVALLPQDKDDGFEECVHECYLWPLSKEQLEIGRAQYLPVLKMAWAAMQSDCYPGYSDDGVINVETPEWIKRLHLEG